jgi:hypothetical protein
VYVGETVQPVALGVCLFVLMGYLTFVVFMAPLLVNGSFGTINTFYMLGGFQAVTVISVFLFMKETSGLSNYEK